MRRFIGQLDTSTKNSKDILEILLKEKVEVEKHMKSIDVYIFRSQNDIRENKLLSNVFEIEKKFNTNEEE